MKIFNMKNENEMNNENEIFYIINRFMYFYQNNILIRLHTYQNNIQQKYK